MGIVLALRPGFIEVGDVRSVAIVGLAIFFAAPAGAYVLIWRQDFARRLVRIFGRPLPPRFRDLSLRMLDNFILGLGALYTMLTRFGTSAFGSITIFGLLVAGIMWVVGRWHAHNKREHTEELERLLAIARSDKH